MVFHLGDQGRFVLTHGPVPLGGDTPFSAAPKRGDHEARIRDWCGKQRAGAGRIEVVGLDDVVTRVRSAAVHTQYRDNPVLVTMKVLEAAGLLRPSFPTTSGERKALPA